ncbi:hypothetical protein [Leptolyngbya ohadii]|uniref:hypothetical protein n=1 Tax=Leptolyngbya ohadii TaxID=1962290 RepID=UPI000B59AD8B|nr:hypothetical protein [Leptolyngbya ohadii]
MSNTTIGSIQTYVEDSILLSPSIDQNSVQARVSVTLTDTTLWLVDTSKLSGQTADSRSQFTLLDLQTNYQIIEPFENINFAAATVAPGISLSSQSSYLQTTLPDGSSLMLVQVTGGTQFGSGGMSPLTGGSGGGSTGISTTGSPSGSLTPGGGGSGGGSSSPGGDPGSPSSSTPEQSTSEQSTPEQSIPGQPTGSPQSPTPGSPQSTPTSSNGTPPPGGSFQPPVPVPFNNSPEIGLLLVLALFGYRLLKRSGKLFFQA